MSLTPSSIRASSPEADNGIPSASAPSRGRGYRVLWRVLIALIYLFLLSPLIVVFIISFDTRPYLSFPPAGFTLGSYRALVHNAAFVHGFTVSLIVGAIVAVLSTALGTLSALALARFDFRGKALLSWIFISPLLVPHIVLGMALMLVLAPLYLTDTYTGLVIAHLGITLPYVIRTVSMSLMTMNKQCEEAASVLGAHPLTVFRRVTLPLIWPGLAAGAVIAFLISFDEAVIALFVVGANASTLPVEIFRYVEYKTDPQVAALSVVLILLSLIFVVFIERTAGLRKSLQ